MLLLDTRHDVLDSYNYHDNGNDDLNLDYNLIYFSTNCTPDTPVFLIFLACSCSVPKSDNYLTNHKMGQLTSGREKLAAINICSCLQWY